MNPRHEQSKEPVSAMLAGPYGHPFHPILVTVPIGSWAASLVFDVGSRFASGPAGLSAAAMWTIGIGVLGAVAAGCIGLLDLLAIPAGTRARRTAVTHALLNTAVMIAYALNFVLRFRTVSGGPTPWGLLALSVVSFGAVGVSGFLGGKLAYRYGVRVAAESVQAEGFDSDLAAPGSARPPTDDRAMRRRSQT